MKPSNTDILIFAPIGATHWDTGEHCYLEAVDGVLWYVSFTAARDFFFSPESLKTTHGPGWHVSAHKDGVKALTMYSYCVPLTELK